MVTKIIEATNDNQNWGKFMLLRPDKEWGRRSAIDTETRMSLLRTCGWTEKHLWVLDLQTGEGAWFQPGGIARFDLNKHKIWVCPMFEPFLTWLYKQNLRDLDALPDVINLPDAPFEFRGYRRSGEDDQETLQQAENRRTLLAGLPPESRDQVVKWFADLGLHQ